MMTRRMSTVRSNRLAAAPRSLLAASVLLLGAYAAPAQEEANSAAEPQPIGITDEGLLQLHVRDLELSTVIRMLSVHGRRNIITAPGITGTVNAELHGVTFEEALHAILRSQGLKAITDQNFVFIITQDEYDKMIAADRGLHARLFKLSYLSSTEAYQLITPLLSEDGKAGLVVGVTDDLKERISAVDLVRLGAEALGGKGGGGRPDMAQAGGPDGTKAEAALAAITGALGETVGA